MANVAKGQAESTTIVKPRPAKMRIDLLLVERGLAQSRATRPLMILAGRVMVTENKGEQKVDKPGVSVVQDAGIRLLGDDLPFVSRGGLKLAAALDTGESTFQVGPAWMWVHRPADLPIACCNMARHA